MKRKIIDITLTDVVKFLREDMQGFSAEFERKHIGKNFPLNQFIEKAIVAIGSPPNEELTMDEIGQLIDSLKCDDILWSYSVDDEITKHTINVVYFLSFPPLYQFESFDKRIVLIEKFINPKYQNCFGGIYASKDDRLGYFEIKIFGDKSVEYIKSNPLFEQQEVVLQGEGYSIIVVKLSFDFKGFNALETQGIDYHVRAHPHQVSTIEKLLHNSDISKQ